MNILVYRGSDKKLATITKVDDIQRAFLMEMRTVGEVIGRMVDQGLEMEKHLRTIQ